jgi:hypothetical protein
MPWFSPTLLQPAFTPEGICPYITSILSMWVQCNCSTQLTNFSFSKLAAHPFCRNIGGFAVWLILIRLSQRDYSLCYRTISSFRLHQMKLTG